VLEQTRSELLNWNNTGMSVIEVSHRSPEWQRENADVAARLRALLSVPEEFEIVLMAGGGTLQFSAIPFNLLGEASKVEYVVTGHWSEEAFIECQRLGFPGVEVKEIRSWDRVSDFPHSFSPDAAYVYLCLNETISGVQFQRLPDSPVPLVIDMSSEFLSRPITEWNKIGLCFACAQKNFGCSGLSVVIVRKDLLLRPLKPMCPVTLDYRIQIKNKSIYNTPPTFSIYFTNLILKWIAGVGGVDQIHARNAAKSRLVYEAVDASPYFVNTVDKSYRSEMNVAFFRSDGSGGIGAKNAELDQKFLDYLAKRRIVGVKGHSSVGGFRASLYNAMTDEGVSALVQAINEFPGFG
jgi:phosphoserine aminotransferase